MAAIISKTRSPVGVYELRITLQQILPPIWRRIQVSSELRLCCLHDALQTVMGWTSSHLHRFEKDGRFWGVPEHLEDLEDDDIDILDESQTTIAAILTSERDSLLYVYDFGDNWRHEVRLEKILTNSSTTFRPVCIAGARHCPPEDVGGTSGYEEFLEVIFEPGHQEYEHYVVWAGGPSPVNR